LQGTGPGYPCDLPNKDDVGEPLSDNGGVGWSTGDSHDCDCEYCVDRVPLATSQRECGRFKARCKIWAEEQLGWKMNFKHAMILLLIVAFAGIAYQAVYKVDVDEVAVITQFGKIACEPKTPGLHVKLPFQKAHFYSTTRIYRNETDAFRVKTKDNKVITVLSFAMWKIKNANLFYKTVYSAENTVSRMDDILFIAIRNTIASYTIEDIKNNHMHKEEKDLIINHNINKNIHMFCQSRLEKFGIQLERVGVQIKEFAS
jgi:regulator of protease activity HflC (stomatin/prohibitin superfamily)